MSQFDSITPLQRSSPTYFPPCANCSHLGVMDFTDLLTAPNAYRAARASKLTGHAWRIERCCSLSETSECFADEAAAASWWRQARLVPASEPATANRQALTLQRLAAANLEPCAPPPPEPAAPAQRWQDQADERRLGI